MPEIYICIQQSVLITKESKLTPMVCTTILHFQDRDVKVTKNHHPNTGPCFQRLLR